jgi:hypothetical protein
MFLLSSDQESCISYWKTVQMYYMLLTSAQESLNIGNEFTRKNLWSFALRNFKQRLYKRQKIKRLNLHEFSWACKCIFWINIALYNSLCIFYQIIW